jgi:phosphonate transport system substrate-binding protein
VRAGSTPIKEATVEQKHEGRIFELDRRQFITGACALTVLGLSASLVGCTEDKPTDTGTDTGGGTTEEEPKKDTSPITVVFLPDNSSSDLTSSRDAIGEAIKAACGRDAELMTTTDYNVAIEAIASGSAGMALLGAEGYVQANRKNPKVQACFTDSDEEGGLDGACYYSRICVRLEDADAYRSGSDFTLEPLKGKSFSFVSATSTSGFKVPSAKIVSEFKLDSNEVLLENGSFFSNVLLGGSHQGSVVNLVSGDADAAAFDDIDVDMYLDLVSGEANMPGSVYKVRDDAEDPFDRVQGKEFIILSSTPVLNAPFMFNEDVIEKEDREAIVAYFCSAKVAGDKRIFKDPKDDNAKAIYTKDTDKTCFVEVTDAWYEPIRRLS